jgi:hypothetical protein
MRELITLSVGTSQSLLVRLFSPKRSLTALRVAAPTDCCSAFEQVKLAVRSLNRSGRRFSLSMLWIRMACVIARSWHFKLGFSFREAPADAFSSREQNLLPSAINEQTDRLNVFFSEGGELERSSPRRTTAAHSLSRTANQKYVPRAMNIDLEPSTSDAIRGSKVRCS